jgi:hypothetical protein
MTAAEFRDWSQVTDFAVEFRDWSQPDLAKLRAEALAAKLACEAEIQTLEAEARSVLAMPIVKAARLEVLQDNLDALDQLVEVLDKLMKRNANGE